MRYTVQRFTANFLVTIAIGLMLLGSRVTQAQAKGVPQAGHLPQVSLDGGYFVANGKRFIPVGAHWVPAKAAMQWITQWDPKDIQADFAKMHELGYTVTRFDVMWAWFEPRAGDYNPEAFQQLDYLISCLLYTSPSPRDGLL